MSLASGTSVSGRVRALAAPLFMQFERLLLIKSACQVLALKDKVRLPG